MIDTATIDQRAAQIGQSIDRAVADLRSRKDLAVTLKDRLTKATADEAVATDAHALLVALSDSRREVVKSRVERIVTAALAAVLGPGVSFRLEASIKRGVVSMVPQIGYGPAPLTRWVGVDSVGGGVVDITAFVLRVCVLLMRDPPLRPVLVADEPFKHVSDDYLPAVAAMVRRLADDTGIQFLIVSHEQEIAACADRVFRVERPGDSSVLTIERGA